MYREIPFVSHVHASRIRGESALIRKIQWNPCGRAVLRRCFHPNSTRYLILYVEIFSTLHCTVHWKFAEGSKIDIKAADTKRVLVAEISGKCRNILLGERTALNILTRASGIATQVRTDPLRAQSPIKSVGFGNA